MIAMDTPNNVSLALEDLKVCKRWRSHLTQRAVAAASAPLSETRPSVRLAAHYYSAPHRFARAEVDTRLTARTVEIFLKGERIAAHMRVSGNHGHTTVPEHMPSSHRRYAGWTIERIRADARLIGPARGLAGSGPHYRAGRMRTSYIAVPFYWQTSTGDSQMSCIATTAPCAERCVRSRVA